MVRFLKKIVTYFLRVTEVHLLIKELNEREAIKKCQALSIGEATFYPEARVFNYQHNKERIQTGKNSHIRGELLVFGYGGQIIIGNNCYLGEHTRIWSGEKVILGNDILISHNVNIFDSTAHEINSDERAE